MFSAVAQEVHIEWWTLGKCPQNTCVKDTAKHLISRCKRNRFITNKSKDRFGSYQGHTYEQLHRYHFIYALRVDNATTILDPICSAWPFSISLDYIKIDYSLSKVSITISNYKGWILYFLWLTRKVCTKCDDANITWIEYRLFRDESMIIMRLYR